MDARVMRAIGASEKMASVAGNQGVDQVEARNGRRRRVEEAQAAERLSGPAELIVEHIGEQEAGEENRQRYARGGDDTAGVVDERTLPHGRQRTERHRDQGGDHKADEGQFSRGRQPGRDIGRDGLTRGQGFAEVAVGEISDIADELLRQRLIEAELLAHLLDRLRRGGRSGEISRGVARQHPGEQEGDDDDPDQARDHGREAPADLFQHGLTPPRRRSPDGATGSGLWPARW
jgi:hypothetical protein